MSANPQGKGLVPILDAWQSTQPQRVEAKSARRILGDYFTSLLVLSAEFSFKPCLGVTYYLYWCGAQPANGSGWKLSLIAPQEWGEHSPGVCLGQCELRTDMTWELTLIATLKDEPELQQALQQFHEGFSDMLDNDKPIEEGLPFFVGSLPYYRLLLSNGLASSLQKSINLSELQGSSGRHWRVGIGGDVALGLSRDIP